MNDQIRNNQVYPKQLPKRAASRASYIFWMLIGFSAIFWATLQFVRPDGNVSFGLIALFGAIGMIMRETSLRLKWKRKNG